MPELSRRRALQALAAGAAGVLAGCRERNLFAEETPEVRRRRAVEDYEVRKVRDTEARLIFWTEEQTPPSASGEKPPSLDGSAPFDYGTHTYLTTPEERATVTFAPGSTAGDRLRAFVEATDFAERSVALVADTVAQCRDFRLLGVAREPDGYELSFCRPFRSPETACDAETEDTVAVAVRLPFPGDSVSGRGTSWHGDCRGEPYPIFPETPTEGEDG